MQFKVSRCFETSIYQTFPNDSDPLPPFLPPIHQSRFFQARIHSYSSCLSFRPHFMLILPALLLRDYTGRGEGSDHNPPISLPHANPSVSTTDLILYVVPDFRVFQTTV